uniref:Uncharacterized protein n=1 Tax=Chionoecetes opilio bacilliform virus TaxID=1825681 RepID=A0A1Q3DL60_9VIRU|nr:hypothetical protein [Chionoecetes opilio bacilliform virus]GAV93214.1 hypothetical protein SCV_094 [Chionoecetes opilio bacilliform virus]
MLECWTLQICFLGNMWLVEERCVTVMQTGFGIDLHTMTGSTMSDFSSSDDMWNHTFGCGGLMMTTQKEYRKFRMQAINKRWDKEIEKGVKGTNTQRITFGGVTATHHIIAWSFAYQEARRGHWEQLARDRTRLRNRVTRVYNIQDPS